MPVKKAKHPNDVTIGQPVTYVPSHLTDKKNLVEIENIIFSGAPGVEYGIVKAKNVSFIFVAFFPAIAIYDLKNVTAQSCRPDDIYFGVEK